jgi:hypothetical protein
VRESWALQIIKEQQQPLQPSLTSERLLPSLQKGAQVVEEVGARRAHAPRDQQQPDQFHSIMILPQVHLRKPCYDFYFL